MMLEYAIEGHDGSGKTPIAAGVQKYLSAKGVKCMIYAPFQIVNSRIPEADIFVYWEKLESTRKAVSLLRAAIGESRSDAISKKAEVVIYDRHWMTILRCLGMLPAEDKEKESWAEFIPTFFIEAPPEKTKDCKRFSADVPWTSSDSRIEEEYRMFLRLADNYSQHIVERHKVLNREQPLGAIIDSIASRIMLDRNIYKP